MTDIMENARNEMADTLLDKIRFMDVRLRELQDQIETEGSIIAKNDRYEVNPAFVEYADLSESYTDLVETYLALV